MKKDHAKSTEKHQNHTTLPTPGHEASSTAAKDDAPSLTRDELIRQAAYSHYEARNHAQGRDLEDWLQAETKIKQMSGHKDKARETASQES